MAIVSIDPGWLAGEGSPSWQAMRAAISYVWHAQVGKETRIWSDGHAHEPYDARVVPAEDGDNRAAIIRELDGYDEIQRETFVVDQCVELLAQWPKAAWGHESFELRTLAANLSPVRINAKVGHSEVMYGLGRLPYAQTSSYAMTTATESRLKLAGLYRAGLPHATVAAKHCATFLRDCRKDRWLRAEAWPNLFES